MTRSIVAMIASLPFALVALGAGSFTVQEADLVFVSGPEQVQVVNGTLIYQQVAEDGSGWSALFSRAEGQSNMQFSATPGTYSIKVWSVPTDPMNPEREYTASNLVVDTGNAGIDTLLGILAAWGDCPGGPCPHDLNGDGEVNVGDLLLFLSSWEKS